VSATAYVPARGDIVWLTFTPQAGREQAGRRPALVMTTAAYNAKTGLAVLCPITSQVKGYAFECALPSNLKTKGVVLSDHIKSLDWRSRQASFAEPGGLAVIRQVEARLRALLFTPEGGAA
jgi:mRNA interferase MazF